MTPTNPDRLTAIKARCAAATKGPWTSDANIVGWWLGELPGVAVWYDAGDGGRSAVCMCQCDHTIAKTQTAGTLLPLEDADFIAHARADLPWAVSRLEQLQVDVQAVMDMRLTKVFPLDVFNLLQAALDRSKSGGAHE